MTGADIHIDEFKCVVCGSELSSSRSASYTCPKCKAHDMMLHQGDTGKERPPRRAPATSGMTTGLPAGTSLLTSRTSLLCIAHAAVAHGLADQVVLVGAVDRDRPALWPEGELRLKRAGAESKARRRPRLPTAA